MSVKIILEHDCAISVVFHRETQQRFIQTRANLKVEDARPRESALRILTFIADRNTVIVEQIEQGEQSRCLARNPVQPVEAIFFLCVVVAKHVVRLRYRQQSHTRIGVKIVRRWPYKKLVVKRKIIHVAEENNVPSGWNATEIIRTIQSIWIILLSYAINNVGVRGAGAAIVPHSHTGQMFADRAASLTIHSVPLEPS